MGVHHFCFLQKCVHLFRYSHVYYWWKPVFSYEKTNDINVQTIYHMIYEMTYK
jgi:hypothetical protein